MKRKIKLLILPLFVLLSSCHLFLGSEPDTDAPEVLKSLWTDFNNIHANLDFRMSSNLKYNSWYDVYHNPKEGYALNVSSGMSEEALFNECAKMLKELNDPHVGLYAPGKFFSSYKPDPDTGQGIFNISDVKYILAGNGDDTYKNFVYGKFKDNPYIGYIYISSFMNENTEQKGEEWGRAIQTIIEALAETSALVLDVRNNRGGDIYVMEYIAAYFASERKDYIKARIKKGPEPNNLSDPIIYTVKSVKAASNNRYGYTKPIVLLTNKKSVSAAEWFTMALRTQKHVTHAGTTTCGAFSARNDRFMINGWIYSISPERVTDMNDKHYEGIGIHPDIEIDDKDSYAQLNDAIKLAIRLTAGEE